MDIEATEGSEIVSDAKENEPVSSHEGEAVAQEHDLSSLTKKELVDMLKQLVHENDLRKSESTIRELRHQFEERQDQERSEALKRFLDLGGLPNDFEYRHDALDISFEANFKVLRNKRLEHHKSVEAQKQENYRLKSEVLDQLRKLVDGEARKHSFDKFKEIQKQWKEIGSVPAMHVRPLWATYHALIDRYYDNRSIYFELKELDRRKNLEAKLELCQRAEKLAEVEKIGVAVRELNELHEEYKHIGPVAPEEKDGVWERFKKASDAVFARRDVMVSQIQETQVKSLGAKEEIIQAVTDLSNFESDRIKEWNQKTSEILSLQKKWEAAGAVPRNRSKDVNKRFWSTFKQFFSRKGQFFEKLGQSRAENLEKKKALVQKAIELKTSQDWEKASNELKNLQVQWKEIGPVPDKHRDKIYQEFKSACDHFFEQRRHMFEESEKSQVQNLEQKEALCLKLEAMIKEKNGSVDKIKSMQKEFNAIGLVPRKSIPIKSRFNDLFRQAIESIDGVSAEEKEQVILEIQLENLKTDPDAGFKIQQKEHGLRKRIQKEENDLATLKNNLEFFGRSKNADKVKAEFSQKLSEGEEILARLKKQLKQLRTATRQLTS